MNEGLNTLSAADVAAVTRNNDGNMWGDGGWFWIIILAFLFCGNGWGNNNGAQDAFISDEFVKRDIFNTNQNVSNTACETQRDVLEKEAYEQYAHTLRENGHVADAMFVECLVEDVSEELKTVECMINDLISTGYDMVYITEIQSEIHDKYKKKMKGIEV